MFLLMRRNIVLKCATCRLVKEASLFREDMDARSTSQVPHFHQEPWQKYKMFLQKSTLNSKWSYLRQESISQQVYLCHLPTMLNVLETPNCETHDRMQKVCCHL